MTSSVDAIPDKYVQCRIGHDWVPHDLGRDKAYYYPVYRCRRCDMKKQQTLHIRTGIYAKKPVYFDIPPGYHVRGNGRLDRADYGKIRLRALESVWEIE